MKKLKYLAIFTSASAYSCGFPVEKPNYDLEPTRTAEDRLVQLYAGEDKQCAEAVAKSCAAELDECLAAAGCDDLTACIREVGHPGADAICAHDVVYSKEARRAQARLRDCAASRGTECEIGQDFSCVDNYTAPRPPATSLFMEQKLILLGHSAPATDISVEICSLLPDCEDPIVTTETDAQGTFGVEIPIQQYPASVAGWRGFRRLTGESIGSIRLQTNVPIWGDLYEETTIVTRATMEQLLNLVGLSDTQVLLVQIFDCQAVGAGDIVVSVDDYEQARIIYNAPGSLTGSPDGATSAEAEGAASIVELEPDRLYHVSARRKRDNFLVADGDVYLEEKQVAHLTLRPNYRGK